MDLAIWIVDGNNMIQRDSRLAPMLQRGGWESATRALESELAQFRRRKGRGHSVVLVYDGVRPPETRDRSTKGFRILYAGRLDADVIVLEEARRHEGRTEVNVISSDRQDIGAALRGLRVHWHRVEEFARDEMRRGGRRNSGSSRSEEVDPEDEKPAPPRGAEVDRWLEIFSDDEEGPDA